MAESARPDDPDVSDIQEEIEHSAVAGTGMPPWLPRALTLVLAYIVGSLIVFYLVRKLSELLTWLVIALFLSFALEPAVNGLVRRFNWKRGAATGLVILLLVLVGLGVVVLLVPIVVKDGAQLVGQLPHILDKLSDFTKECCNVDISDPEVLDKVANLGSAASAVASNLASAAAYLLTLLFSLLSILTFTFFFVADGPRFRRGVCSLLPPKRQESVLRAWDVAVDKTGGYFYSRLLLGIIYASVAFIFLSILQVPFALVLSITLGLIAELIPTIGPWIGGIPVALVAMVDDPKKGIWVIVFLFVYQTLENFTIAPKLTAKTMKINPAVAFGAVIAGASLGGIIGAILAIPAAGIIQAIFREWVERKDLRYRVVDDELTREDEDQDEDQDEDGGKGKGRKGRKPAEAEASDAEDGG